MLMNIAFAYLLLLDKKDHPYKVTVPLLVHGARLYAATVMETIFIPSSPHLLLTIDHPSMISALHDDPTHIIIISDEPSKLLWHARLGHLNFRLLSSMHLFATGIPQFKQSHASDKCAECLMSKLRRSPRGYGTIQSRANVHGQILCADWGFICQNSSDTDRDLRLSSVHGDATYFLHVHIRVLFMVSVLAPNLYPQNGYIRSFTIFPLVQKMLRS